MRGGKRKGAGRKPSGKVTVWFRVNEETASFLMAMEADEREAFMHKAVKRQLASTSKS